MSGPPDLELYNYNATHGAMNRAVLSKNITILLNNLYFLQEFNFLVMPIGADMVRSSKLSYFLSLSVSSWITSEM